MSYCVYIGKNLTADGRAYLAGYGDEPSSHWLEIVPRQQHAPADTVTVGVTPEAMMPGQLSQIPQVAETARNIRVSYTYYRGVPAPITNGGLNEYGVAVRDIWSTSRDELTEMTPSDQSGPNYSDLARLVLERAKSAREGVELIGDLIAAYGYSTYGGNSHFIADHNEGWVVIEFAGGQGLWAAQRVGPDEIRASRPGYIEAISKDDPNVLTSPNFFSFATEQGWYDAAAGEPFNANKIYGDGKGRWDGVRWIEAEMRRRAARPEKVSITDAMWAVRTQYLTGDTAGYGQVVPLEPRQHASLGVLWHTASGAVAAPFAPVFMGTQSVPPEFAQHRYLTYGESSRFLDSRHGDEVRSHVAQSVEASRSAVYAVKRLMYLLLAQHEDSLPEATAIFEAFESKLLSAIEDVIKSAEYLLNANEPDLAHTLLTYFSNTELHNGLRLVDTLTNHYEARARLQQTLPTDDKFKGPQQLW